MPLDEVIEELIKKQKIGTPYCAYQNLYNSLETTEQKALDKAWEAKLPMTVILRAIRAEGHKMSKDSIIAHSKRQCRCPK